jgi:hypothetical protein
MQGTPAYIASKGPKGNVFRASPIVTENRVGVDVPRGRGRVGSQPGGGLTLQSGCPDGSAFQNMILSK